jgi:single-stranded-DNA-specific exonuclease
MSDAASNVYSARNQRWSLEAVAPVPTLQQLTPLAKSYLDSMETTAAAPRVAAGGAAGRILRGAKAERKDYSAVVGALLSQRGIDADSAPEFLNTPNFNDFLARVPEYLQLKDMKPAIERVALAIRNHEKIGISGDYDCDGNCSVALLKRTLLACGVPEEDIIVHVPNRVAEGYGVNSMAVDELHKQGVNLLITLDNGTLANKPIERAGELGMETIVVDHHPNSAGHSIPKGALVVNPNRSDETHADPALKSLAAVGVTFLLSAGIKDYFSHQKDNRARKLELRDLLGLTAMATVGDVVNIKGNINRFFVREGVKVINEGRDEAINQLCRAANVAVPMDEETIAFRLAPIINAPGRMGQSVAWEFLASSKQDQPEFLLKRIMSNETNEERKRQEAAITKEARTQAQAILANDADTPVLVLAGDDWPEGVVGIVAGRMKEEFGRPVLACARVEGPSADGGTHYHYKTSGRSVEGVDLGSGFRALAEGSDPAFIKAGGHPMAAGGTFELGKLEEVRSRLCSRLKDDVQKARSVHAVPVAGVIPLDHVKPDLIRSMAAVGPFGQGNRKPLVVIPDVTVRDLNISKTGQHFFLNIASGRQMPVGSKSTGVKPIKAVAFHVTPGVEQALRQAQKTPCQLLGSLALDAHTGAPVLRIEDVYISPAKQRLPYAGVKEILGDQAMEEGAFVSLWKNGVSRA